MHNPRNGALQKVSSIHNKRQNHSMHSPAFAMKAQQNNCLNITLKFITCRNTRGFQYMQIQKHITLHRVNESWKHFWRNLKKPRSTYFWNISSRSEERRVGNEDRQRTRRGREEEERNGG